MLVGPNGVGKSTLAQNIAHQALIQGHTVLFTSAGQMLGDLARSIAIPRCAAACAIMPRPQLLVIDEVGYLSLLQSPRRPDVRTSPHGLDLYGICGRDRRPVFFP